MRISIITPVLDEEQQLIPFLASLENLRDCEIILVDGGSRDRSREIIGKSPVRLLTSPPGRGSQQNHGARAARGEVLLFLHCDSRLPMTFRDDIRQVLARPHTAGGAFRLAIDHPGNGYRLIEWGANSRSALLQLPYGDQALFMTRDLFLRVGGFPHRPIGEELPLLRSLQKHGRIRLTSTAVLTSARRWERLGLIRTTLFNQLLLLGIGIGISPERLARFYRGGGSGFSS